VSRKIYLKARTSAARIDQFLAAQVQEISRSFIEKLILAGKVTLNGRVVVRKNQPLTAGDRIEIEKETEVKPEYHPTRPLFKRFEDEWILIIEKPEGISVHPGAGERDETILDIFRYHYPEITNMSEKDRPGLVHRLDKDTSGLLLLAKDERSMLALQRQFKERQVHKQYLALVSGAPHLRHGTIDAPLARDLRNRVRFKALYHEEREDQRKAITHFSVLFQWSDCAFLRIHPETGRTHQIRVHLSSIGHPVLGDRLYGNRKDKKFERLALHAYSLRFHHPVNGLEMESVSPLPSPLRNWMRNHNKQEYPHTQKED